MQKKLLLREGIDRGAADLFVVSPLAPFQSKDFVLIAELPLQETSLCSSAGMARPTVNDTKVRGTGREN
jgi:hypothetical protein